MATAGNLPLWRELLELGLLDTPASWLFAFGIATLVAGCLVALLSLCCWPGTLKPAVGILLAFSAIGSYFMWTYHIVVDANMVLNVLETDFKEASALLNFRMLGAIVVLFALPMSLVVRFPLRRESALGQLGRNTLAVLASLLLVAAVLMASYQSLASSMRNHKQLRYLMNPLNTVYALGNVATKPLRQGDSSLHAVGSDAVGPVPSSRPPLIVLVIGETARAENFEVNGYGRPTTPGLKRERVVAFTDVTACGTSTAASLPCMFSHLGRQAFERRAYNYENVLDVLHRAGVAVLWLDNQSGCKGVCDRVPHQSTSAAQHPTLCRDGECLDEVMLEGLEGRLNELPAERRAVGTVLVLHQMGSHGPAYYLRSPPKFKRFLPECTSNNLQECSREALLNAYDNSIAYTDHFLSATIGWLKAHESAYAPALVYVSDHGESLGENNLYLHGLPFSIAPDTQKKVPWVTWFSSPLASQLGIDVECLRQRSGSPMSHDNLVPSILGLLQIQTSIYKRESDVYSSCTATSSGPRADPDRLAHARLNGN
jgi:lipid A ethanolaminephosphotransferase